MQQEISQAETDTIELKECKAVLKSELQTEAGNIEELTQIIGQLKRNLLDARREKEKAV